MYHVKRYTFLTINTYLVFTKCSVHYILSIEIELPLLYMSFSLLCTLCIIYNYVKERHGYISYVRASFVQSMYAKCVLNLYFNLFRIESILYLPGDVDQK